MSIKGFIYSATSQPLMMHRVCFVAAVYRSQRAAPPGDAPRYKRNAPCLASSPTTFSPTTNMENTLYCPIPHTYVVAQLDIQATLRNLDAQAQEAAQTTLKPAKCLLYLYDVS